MKRLALLTGILALAAPLALAQTTTLDLRPGTQRSRFQHQPSEHFQCSWPVWQCRGNPRLNDADITKSDGHGHHRRWHIDTGVRHATTDLKSRIILRCGQVSHGHIHQHQCEQERQRPYRERQPDFAWRDQAGGAYSGGPTGPVTARWTQATSGFSATTTFNRTDFGIGAKFRCSHAGRRRQAHHRARRHQAVDGRSLVVRIGREGSSAVPVRR